MRRQMKFPHQMPVWIMLLILLAGCRQRVPVVYIAAAASLEPVLQQLAPRIEAKFHVQLRLNTAASGILSRQILQGGPAQIFISANTRWMDELEMKGRLVTDSRLNLLGNRLIVVTRADLPDPPRQMSDLTNPRYWPLAMGDWAYVPAGQYAKEALENAHLWTALQDHTTAASNVQAALAYVAHGESPVGIVYASDIIGVDKVRNAFDVPESLHTPIVYPAAVIQNGGSTTLPHEILQWLRSEEARHAFQGAGFTVQ